MCGSGRARYEVLDGMRGVAALCVMIFHYGQATRYTVFHCAGLAVDLFFMLSGFVIAHAWDGIVQT
jgi:peptidoglycan/LPS O-acetylase OafA/YrhL